MAMTSMTSANGNNILFSIKNVTIYEVTDLVGISW